jgi:hypothetical protein
VQDLVLIHGPVAALGHTQTTAIDERGHEPDSAAHPEQRGRLRYAELDWKVRASLGADHAFEIADLQGERLATEKQDCRQRLILRARAPARASLVRRGFGPMRSVLATLAVLHSVAELAYTICDRRIRGRPSQESSNPPHAVWGRFGRHELRPQQELAELLERRFDLAR